VTPLGNDVHGVIVAARCQGSTKVLSIGEEGMTGPKGSRPLAGVDGAGVHAKNAINVAMEDLSEEDQKEIEREHEMEMAERHSKKLACFQKTQNKVSKKADMATTSNTKIDSPLSPEDLVQLVDVSVASKYGADLTQFTRVIA
jgi:hypothetical protein